MVFSEQRLFVRIKGQILYNADRLIYKPLKKYPSSFFIKKTNLTTEFVEKNNLSRTSVNIYIYIYIKSALSFLFFWKHRNEAKSVRSKKATLGNLSIKAYVITHPLWTAGYLGRPQTPRLKCIFVVATTMNATKMRLDPYMSELLFELYKVWLLILSTLPGYER